MIQARRNEQMNGIEVIFPGPINKDWSRRMRGQGFKFSSGKGLWWAKFDASRWAFARKLAGVDSEETAFQPGEKRERSTRKAPAPSVTMLQSRCVHLLRQLKDPEMKTQAGVSRYRYMVDPWARCLLDPDGNVIVASGYKSRDWGNEHKEIFFVDKLGGFSKEISAEIQDNWEEIPWPEPQPVPKKKQDPHYKEITRKTKINKAVLWREILMGKMLVYQYRYFDGMQDMWVNTKKPTFSDAFEDLSFISSTLGDFMKGRSDRKLYTDEGELTFEDFRLTYKPFQTAPVALPREYDQLERKKIAAKLREKAQKLEDKINAPMPFEGMNMTRRRLSFVASAEKDRDALREAKAFMVRLAGLWEANQLPSELQHIRHISQVEIILSRVRYYRRYGKDPVFPHFDKRSDSQQRKETAKRISGWHKLGVKDPLSLLVLVQEAAQLVQEEEETEEKKIQQLERNLVGKKIKGFHPTPKDVIDLMLDEATIQPGAKILEPSAGKGDIAEAIRDRYPDAELEVVELNPDLREILQLKGFKVVGWDFMEHKGEYDYIIMNPPFHDGLDRIHIQHAYKLLRSGGKLVSISAPGIFFRQKKADREFRDWFEARHGWKYALTKGAFKNSFNPTNVNTVMVIMDKEEEPEEERANERHQESAPTPEPTFFQIRCAFALRQVADPSVRRYDPHKYKDPWAELYQDKEGNLIVANGDRSWPAEIKSEARIIDTKGQFKRVRFKAVPADWQRIGWPELTETPRKSAAPAFDLGTNQRVSQLQLWQEILLGKMKVRKKGVTDDRRRPNKVYSDALTDPEFLAWGFRGFFSPLNPGGYRGVPGVIFNEGEISYHDFGFIYRKSPMTLAELRRIGAKPDPSDLIAGPFSLKDRKLIIAKLEGQKENVSNGEHRALIDRLIGRWTSNQLSPHLIHVRHAYQVDYLKDDEWRKKYEPGPFWEYLEVHNRQEWEQFKAAWEYLEDNPREEGYQQTVEGIESSLEKIREARDRWVAKLVQTKDPKQRREYQEHIDSLEQKLEQRKQDQNQAKIKGKHSHNTLNSMNKQRFSKPFELELRRITVWPKQFQGRKSDYSKETVDKILAEGYDKSQEPIVVWLMPVEGKGKKKAYVVLSGHSRYQAAQILYDRGNKDLRTIPVKEFNGTLEEAVEFAVVESNRSGTAEGLASDVAAVRMALEKGKNKDYLAKYFKPAGYLRKLMELIPLSPKGKFFTNLDSDARHHFPHLERNARWVGTMRRQIPELKDFHEDELFNYFYPLNKSKREVKKEKIFELVNKTVSSLMWSFDQPLQLEKAARTKAILQPGAEQLRELEKEQEGYQVRRVKLEERLAKAQKEDDQNGIKRLQGQISDLNKLILRVIQDKQRVEREMGKLERKTTHDLFSQPPTQPKRKPMKKPKLEVVAADAENDVQVKTYNDGKQKGVEIHFVDSPSPFALQMLKNAKFQLAFRDGKPYQFRPFSRTALKDAKQIASVHTRTKEMAEKEVKVVKSQQKKGAVFVTKEKELINRPIEGAFKLPELEAEKRKAAPKKKTPAKKPEPAPAKARTTSKRSKVGVTRKERKRKPTQSQVFPTGARQIGAGDVQKMKFPLISVPGGIGEWLGGIDRNGLAITIRGEKGSGKSHLMYQFAEAFQAMGWKGAVFTLEEGIGATTQQKVAQYKLTNAVKLIEEPYLEEIRTTARRNDFVMIDSWGKTDGLMKDFDQLRKDFPQTVFVVIFQENQAGKVRGGSSFEYDAVITIETEKVEEDKKVLDRIALITKSRYDSKHIYSIQNQTVLQ